MHLQDPLLLDQMHDVMLPNPNLPHGLKEHLSWRGESNLESFHLMLAHFGNAGMRETLADNLNLTGMTRFNVKIRHKLRLSKLTDKKTRAFTPCGWETVPDYFNHSELEYVNKLARSDGIQKDQEPFQSVEHLPPDNGERFFSKHLAWLNDTKPKIDENNMCLCDRCCGTTTTQQSTANQLQETKRCKWWTTNKQCSSDRNGDATSDDTSSSNQCKHNWSTAINKLVYNASNATTDVDKPTFCAMVWLESLLPKMYRVLFSIRPTRATSSWQQL